MKVRYTASARTDLRKILNFISDRNPSAARRLHEGIAGAVSSLTQNARRGRAIGQALDGEERRLIVGPYLLVYEIEGQVIWVVRILHGGRDIPRVLDQGESSEEA